MSYKSIDNLQKALSESVFSHTKDSKKAAGRALGTMVEIITYYLLNQWGVSKSISIERGLAEYGNPTITHNVEFTLHPIFDQFQLNVNAQLPLTSTKIINYINLPSSFVAKKSTLLDKNKTLKNACAIAESESNLLLSSINTITDSNYIIDVYLQHKQPYTMFECKRVGVEERNKKGPQTIEKAKQGAYVAQTTSSLQKIRTANGEKYGVIYKNNQPILLPYNELLNNIINSNDKESLKRFTMSVGIVSNHGNWFTSDTPNKELKVLAQSYDWLLFLTDIGLSQFITDLLLSPHRKYAPIKDAFLNSYKEGKKTNNFTKVKMQIEAHDALCAYFKDNIKNIESWFNIISPEDKSLFELKEQISLLQNKNWENIL